jgi:protein required for attachment to host cells
MSDYCVVVADGTRARLFTLEAAAAPGVEGGPDLIEQIDLVNPESGHGVRATTAKSGRDTGRGSGPMHGFVDHRSQHEDEFLRRFAKLVAETALRTARERRTGHLVLVAGNRILGFLRSELQAPTGESLQVQEVAKDLSRLSAYELHEHLGGAGVLPRRKKASI